MLTRLTIADFAIIESLDLPVSPGLTIVTGDAGAGKSIIIDALSVLLGSRFDADFIRTGSDRARVEGVFQVGPEGGPIPDTALAALLTDAGIDCSEGVLILSREMERSGRSVSRASGKTIPASLLRQVGQRLVDIHVQGEQASLLRPEEHLGFLDRYAQLASGRQHMTALVTELRQARRELQEHSNRQRELQQRADLLQFQVQEIAGADLRPGEDTELEAELQLIASAEQRARLAHVAHAALQEGQRGDVSAVDSLGQAAVELAEMARMDASAQQLADAAEALQLQAAELASSLRRYRDDIDFSPERLESVQERLALIQRLKRKYGATIEDILAQHTQAAAELEQLERWESDQSALASEIEQLTFDAAIHAAWLSLQRRAAAEELGVAVEKELQELGLSNAQFQTQLIQERADDGLPVSIIDEQLEPGVYAFSETGIDRVEFVISLNPGEPLRPLHRVASGGETSLTMLALKVALGGASAIPTMVFDEIETGLGGRGGHVVGEKLAALATGARQVLCITHLPQIACYGDAHLKVTKLVREARTVTAAQGLGEEDRTAELAVMLGEDTPANRRSAVEMTRRAQAWKEQWRRPVPLSDAWKALSTG